MMDPEESKFRRVTRRWMAWPITWAAIAMGVFLTVIGAILQIEGMWTLGAGELFGLLAGFAAFYQSAD